MSQPRRNCVVGDSHAGFVHGQDPIFRFLVPLPPVEIIFRSQVFFHLEMIPKQGQDSLKFQYRSTNCTSILHLIGRLIIGDATDKRVNLLA